MPKIKTISVYSFDELDDCAKETARAIFRNDDCWLWQSDWWASAQAFCRIAPIEIRSADYDAGHVSVRCDAPELSGLRAWKWLQNNEWFDLAARNKAGECTLTGFCGDCDLFDPIAALANKPLQVPELSQLFYECAQSWVFAARADCEYSYSDECIDELICANDYEFMENGRLA